jgi:poly-gamma-glutamate synthesis protein (capsule biosynthesis protein)
MSKVKLIAVGDICLQTKNNVYPFRNVEQAFEGKDILFGNLETVLSNKGKKSEKAVLLHTFPKKVKYLKDAHFDILNVANNHVMDLGPEGFNDTLEVLNQSELKFIGAGNQKFIKSYKIIERKGIKLGFLGYSKNGFNGNIFINKIDKNLMVGDIKHLRLKCDVIVVSLHWGIENVFYPSPEQIKLARNLIDAGANLVLGHHPHVVQGIEKYKNGLIVYSLGNFQFITDRERNKKSIILSVEINKNGIEEYKIIPIKINEDFVPYVMNNQKTQEMLSFVDAISHQISEGKVIEKWWFEEIAREHLGGNMEAWIVRIKKFGIKHLFQCIKWLISPFIVKCYLGLLRRQLKKYD